MAMKRQSVISAILSALENVTVASGYYNTFSNHVYEMAAEHTDITEFPFVNVIEIANESVQSIAANSFHEMHNLLVDIEVTSGGTTFSMESARKLVMDVIKAMRTIKYGGTALDCNYIRDSIKRDVTETITVTATVSFSVTYRTELMKES